MTMTDIKEAERMWLTPSLDEVYDLQWSPDSSSIIAGAINARAEIIRIATRDTLLLTGHNSYIQGVAWDPLNEMVVTQSADRSCKIHMVQFIYIPKRTLMLNSCYIHCNEFRSNASIIPVQNYRIEVMWC